MAKKVPVIMIQAMGGMGINYVSGQEVLVPEDVAEAWVGGQVAVLKKGRASEDAAVHPDPIDPEAEAKADAEAAQAESGTSAEAGADAAQAGGAP